MTIVFSKQLQFAAVLLETAQVVYVSKYEMIHSALCKQLLRLDALTTVHKQELHTELTQR